MSPFGFVVLSVSVGILGAYAVRFLLLAIFWLQERKGGDR